MTRSGAGGTVGAMQTAVGVGAPSQQSVTATAGGSATLQPAIAGSLLNVFLPATAVQVGSGYTAGVQQAVPFSGNPSTQQPYQFILDGNPGQLTMTWTDSGTQKKTQFVMIVQGQYGQFPQPPPPAPPQVPPFPYHPYPNPFPVVHLPPPPPAPIVAGSGNPNAPAPSASSSGSALTYVLVGAGVLALAAGGYVWYQRSQQPAPQRRPRARR